MSHGFFKMAVIELKSTYEFRFSDCIRSKWCSFICIPNFDEISQSTVEIKLLTAILEFYLLFRF